MSNPELEAAEEQIQKLKFSVGSLEEELERQTDTLNAQAAIIAQLRASLAESEVELGLRQALLADHGGTLSQQAGLINDLHCKADEYREYIREYKEEIRILKETVITLATKGSRTPAPSTPHSANSTLNMLSQMISSESAAQEREWRG